MEEKNFNSLEEAYQATLAYLFSRLPMYQRQGASAYKKDLTNTLALCAYLGQPQEKYKTIHIAGTNGKGTVSHLLAGMLQSCGFRVGLYTSPHYKDFRERIKVDGQLAPKEFVVDFVQQHRDFIESCQPSFFELTVGMAFDYFAKEDVDIAVIEVGLGGRLDSTNVITPMLSVITNISFDHMDMLGDTLEKIAGEKAGIIKPSIPVVIGEYHPETFPVFESVALERQAPMTLAENFELKSGEVFSDGITDAYSFDYEGREYSFETDFIGPFQEKNLRTAIQSLLTFHELNPIPLKRVMENFLQIRNLVKYQGRWQMIRSSPRVLVDSGHNEGGIRIVVEGLKRYDFQRLHMVVGFVQDKDLTNILKILPTNATYYFVKADIPRGLDAGKLQDLGTSYGLHGEAFGTVSEGLRAAIETADSENDLIFVGGSIFVVAEVL